MAPRGRRCCRPSFVGACGFPRQPRRPSYRLLQSSGHAPGECFIGTQLYRCPFATFVGSVTSHVGYLLVFLGVLWRNSSVLPHTIAARISVPSFTVSCGRTCTCKLLRLRALYVSCRLSCRPSARAWCRPSCRRSSRVLCRPSGRLRAFYVSRRLSSWSWRRLSCLGRLVGSVPVASHVGCLVGRLPGPDVGHLVCAVLSAPCLLPLLSAVWWALFSFLLIEISFRLFCQLRAFNVLRRLSCRPSSRATAPSSLRLPCRVRAFYVACRLSSWLSCRTWCRPSRVGRLIRYVSLYV